MDVTAALSAAGDLRGYEAKNQLAMVGLKAAMQQQQVVAQVVTAAAEGAGQVASSSLASGPNRGRMLDIRV